MGRAHGGSGQGTNLPQKGENLSTTDDRNISEAGFRHGDDWQANAGPAEYIEEGIISKNPRSFQTREIELASEIHLGQGISASQPGGRIRLTTKFCADCARTPFLGSLG